MTVEQAKEMIKTTSGLVILDVRNYTEFNSGHIEGARCIPLYTLQQNLSKLNPQSQILVYCAKGSRSLQAANILVNSGFQHVYNMIGGIEAWKKANNPVVMSLIAKHQTSYDIAKMR